MRGRDADRGRGGAPTGAGVGGLSCRLRCPADMLPDMIRILVGLAAAALPAAPIEGADRPTSGGDDRTGRRSARPQEEPIS